MKLLLIHTGGTIAMAPTPTGLAPQDGLVEAAITARLKDGWDLQSHVFAPLLDSSDVGPGDWNRMIDAILATPAETPVIITHGTDTMAFTGAALHQALAGLQRRVILCGSMKPLGQQGDAEENLDLALEAATSAAAGVWLAFQGQIMPAGGLVKHDSCAAAAFRSVPQDEPAEPASRRFGKARVAIFTLSPGFPVAALRAALAEVDGAVLRVFGSGTTMNDPALLDTLAQATARGVRIRVVSQCENGGLHPGAYAAGAGLWATGVENGGVQTPEAALISLWLA